MLGSEFIPPSFDVWNVAGEGLNGLKPPGILGVWLGVVGGTYVLVSGGIGASKPLGGFCGWAKPERKTTFHKALIQCKLKIKY